MNKYIQEQYDGGIYSTLHIYGHYSTLLPLYINTQAIFGFNRFLRIFFQSFESIQPFHKVVDDNY